MLHKINQFVDEFSSICITDYPYREYLLKEFDSQLAKVKHTAYCLVTAWAYCDTPQQRYALADNFRGMLKQLIEEVNTAYSNLLKELVEAAIQTDVQRVQVTRGNLDHNYVARSELNKLYEVSEALMAFTQNQLEISK